MGLHQTTKTDFYSIIGGNIRKRVDEDTPGAEPRTLEKGDNKGKVIYELIYSGITGTLKDIYFSEHKDFGRSWVLVLHDKQDFSIRIAEGSRYGADFLKKLPNLKQGQVYSFTPYDFEGDNGNQITGLSIKDQGGEKIFSYYQEFEKTATGNKVKNLHGYPEPEGDTDKFDADDWKMYFMGVTKFLRLAAQDYIEKNFSKDFKVEIVERPKVSAEEPGNFDEDEDIPF